MATGAPAPGGFNAPPPGGFVGPAAGGFDLGNPFEKALVDVTYPHTTIGVVQYVDTGSAESATVDVHLGSRTVSSYAWTLTSKPTGSASTVTTGTTATAHVTPDKAGDYVLTCVSTFSDGVTDSSVTKITAIDPVTLAATQDVVTGAAATAHAVAASVSGRTVSSYAWTITDAPAESTAALTGDTTATAHITPDLDGDYELTLVVTFSNSLTTTVKQVMTAATAP